MAGGADQQAARRSRPSASSGTPSQASPPLHHVVADRQQHQLQHDRGRAGAGPAPAQQPSRATQSAAAPADREHRDDRARHEVGGGRRQVRGHEVEPVSAAAPTASPQQQPDRPAQRPRAAGRVVSVTRATIPARRRPRGTVPPMRALLVVNPKATTTSERSRDVLVRALRSEVDLTVEYTRRRGHAVDAGPDAARERRRRGGHARRRRHGQRGGQRPDDRRPALPARRGPPATGCRPWPWCPAARRTSSPARSACPGTGPRAPA